MKFISSEQAYQYFKALFHARWKLIPQILSCTTSLGCYRLGKSVVTTARWNKEKVEVMLHILRHKIYQCPDFREELLHYDKCVHVFVENTPDTFWGIGNGKGLNTLGALLHYVLTEWQVDHLVQ
jgi:ribA/ribD-fused uncharacterized protein